MPTIAIVMPSFNHAQFIEEAVLSVFNQSCDDWRLYILDNCSTDHTLEVLSPYLSDSRVVFFRNEENIGSFPNIVKGFSSVKEDYCVLLCADDLFEPNYIEAIQESIQNAPDASYYAFGWQAYRKDETGKVFKGRGQIPFPEDFKGKVYLSPFFVYGNFISMLSIVFKTKSVLPFLKEVEQSPIRQIGEICLMKALEEQKGPAYLNAGNFTDWRRHSGQLTHQHNENRQYHVECVMEPLIYCRSKKPKHETFIEINRFMAMIAFLMNGAGMNIVAASRWLCSDLGKKWALTVDFSVSNLEKEALATAFATAFALRMFARHPHLSQEDFYAWFVELQKEKGFHSLKEIFALAQEVYGGFFLSPDLIQNLLRQSAVAFPVTPQLEALHRYYNLLSAHTITASEAKALDVFFAKNPAPRFELCLAVDEQSLPTLALSLRELARLYYDDFALTLFADFPLPKELESVARLSSVNVKNFSNIWETLNAHLLKSSADYAILLEAGDSLLPHALPFLGERLLKEKWAAFYVDEDAVDEEGNVINPYFKPDFLPDYFMAHDYVGDGVFFQIKALKNWGGLELNAPNPVYATLFSLWQKCGQQAIGHVADAFYRRNTKRVLNRAGDCKEWLSAKCPSFEIKNGLIPNTFKILPQTSPETSLLWIVVAQNSLWSMRHFVEHTVPNAPFANTRFAVLVSPNLSSEVLDYLTSMDQNPPENLAFYVVKDSQNQSVMVNVLVEESDAALIFITRPDAVWAEKNAFFDLARYLNMPFVGAVAPRVLTPTGNLLGNAFILGGSGTGIYFGKDSRFDEKGHFGRQLITQNPSALSFDAFLIRKETWNWAGGLDETKETLNAASAIDFSLRILKTGQNLAWLPWISLIITDEARENITPNEENQLLEQYLPQMARDSFYNVNYSRDIPFQLTLQPEVSKTRLSFKSLPRVMAFSADEMGCGHYRVIEPFNAALKANLIEGVLCTAHFNPFDLHVFEADTLFLQRQITDEQLRFLENYRRYSQMKLVFELDDLLTEVDISNDHFVAIYKDAARRLEKALSFCDRFVVSTEPLKEAYRQYIDDVRVVPNYIDKEKWEHLRPQRRAGKKPRVGWAGGVSHRGDLQVIVEVVKRLADEVEWVFLGMCPEEIRNVVEWHSGVPTPEYPQKLASLNLDLAIAPLAHSAFNECKSHLKLMEYGILGYPVVATDFGPYARAHFPVTLVENRPKEWMNAIRAHTQDLDFAEREGKTLRQFVRQHHLLQDHLEEWRSAWLDF